MSFYVFIARAERDGTRAETRIRLSPKRTSPFKSEGASVQSTTGSRGVRISSSNGSNAGQTTFRGKVKLYWLPTPFACFPFTSPPVRHRVPPGSERALPIKHSPVMLLPDIMGPETLTSAENKPHKESEVNYRREWDDEYAGKSIRTLFKVLHLQSP